MRRQRGFERVRNLVMLGRGTGQRCPRNRPASVPSSSSQPKVPHLILSLLH
jgi:hypothetical protein